MPYQSLAGAVSGSKDPDVNSIFSERDMSTSGVLNRPRGARPFSPIPGESLEDPLKDFVVTLPVTQREIQKIPVKEESNETTAGETFMPAQTTTSTVVDDSAAKARTTREQRWKWTATLLLSR